MTRTIFTKKNRAFIVKSSREICGSINIIKFLSLPYPLTAGPNINEESSQERIRQIGISSISTYRIDAHL